MTSIDDMKSLVDFAVEYAASKSEAIIARGVCSSDSQIRFSQSSIDITKRWEGLELELFVVQGAKTGSTTHSVSNQEDVKKAVDDVIDFTKLLPDSMFFAGIEDKVEPYPELKHRYDAKIESFVEESPEVINAIIDAALHEGAARVAGSLMVGDRHLFFKSSLGPEGAGKRTHYELNVRALQNELDYSGQGLHSGTTPSATKDEMIEAGTRAGTLSKQAIGAVQGTPGIYDLILTPTVAANVLGRIPGQANPFSIMTGTSPLKDKLGEQIAPEFITAHEDSLFPGGINSSAFDWEGTPSRTTTIVEKGVLKTLIHNTTTGRMFDSQSTGSSRLARLGMGGRMLLPGASNIVFENGSHSLDDLLDVDRPSIYVTCN